MTSRHKVQPRIKNKTRLYALYKYESEVGIASFDTWQEYIAWKTETKCEICKLVRGFERDPDHGRTYG